MSDPSNDKIMDEREEQMVSPTGGEPTLRVAQFLTPSLTSIDRTFRDLPTSPLESQSSGKNFSYSNLKVSFPGWRNPQKKWKTWTDRMHSFHHSVWKQAGVYDAIMNSTYRIHRNDALLFGFAEKWLPDTNTFMFPWGEATITLEDVMILGGYSVLGDPVFSPIESPELKDVEEKLISARSEIYKTKARKACQHLWLRKFMDSGSELEHEAFLALWLSRFVFPTKSRSDTIKTHVLLTAIHLARGTKFALAPAVLANIYANLTELKEALIFSKRLENSSSKEDNIFELSISAPFQLVQIWVWERFSTLQPKAITLEHDQPRIAKWNSLRTKDIGNVQLAIDEAADYFLWRPYAMGCKRSFFYKEKGEWISVASGISEELEVLVRWVRTSELVGMDSDRIEQYLPHRVAMQFGFDQDVPGHVARANSNKIVAWKNYTRKISDEILSVPSRLFESDVTTRYVEWWKKYTSSRSEDLIKTEISGLSREGLKKKMLLSSLLKKSPNDAFASTNLSQQCNLVRGSGSDRQTPAKTEVLPTEALVPHGFPPKPNHLGIRDSEDSNGQDRTKRLRDGSDGKSKAPNVVRLTGSQYKAAIAKRMRLNSSEKGLLLSSNSSEKKLLLSSAGSKSDNHPLAPRGFQPKHSTVGTRDLGNEDVQIQATRSTTDPEGNDGSRRDSLVLSGFLPKHDGVGTRNSDDKDGQYREKVQRIERDGKVEPHKRCQLEGPISAMVEFATVQKMKEEPLEMNSKNENEKESSKTVLEHGKESSRPGVQVINEFRHGGSGLESGNFETQPLCHHPLSSGSAILMEAGNEPEAECGRELNLNPAKRK